MNKTIRFWTMVIGFAGFASLPLRAVNITSCDQATVQNAINLGGEVAFEVNCHLFLTSPINVPVNATIFAAEDYSVTLDGQNLTGVFTIPAGVSASLYFLNIVNGRTSAGTGGGVSNAGSVVVFDCLFNHNNNAILNTGSLNVAVDTFVGNYAASGGAIMHTGPSKAYITSSTFRQGDGNAATQGGAIYVSGASMEIDYSSFYSNVATEGGAVYAFASTVSLTGDYFNGNTTNPGGSGGAIANLGSNVTITYNSASTGGFQSNQAVSDSTTPGLGGAIYNAGVFTSCGEFCFRFSAASLTLNTILLSGNSAGMGGAIYSAGNTFLGCCTSHITVNNSYLVQNTASTFDSSDYFDGAIHNQGASQFSVTASTFQLNSPEDVYNSGDLNVSNSTGVGNIATFAIVNFGTALVEYSTFDGYATVLVNGGVLTLEATILDPSGEDCFSPITDGGYNLSSTSDTYCGFSSATSRINTNPGLGALALNGGPTLNFALPTGSPAIDKIPPGTLTCGVLGTAPNFNPGAFDQRGVPRPQGTECDIGAIEHLFSNLPTSSTTCDGIYNKTFAGDIEVLPGQKCVFLGGGVTGNVAAHGGDFELRYATVGGNVEIDGDSTFFIGSSATISGNLEIHDLAFSAGQNQVCGASVTGNLQVHNNAAGVAIGTEDQTSCQGNTIGGSLDVHNNSASTTVDGNTVAGDLQDHNNSGPTQIFNNLIQGTLQCNQNSAITGGLDFAKQKQGQCANF